MSGFDLWITSNSPGEVSAWVGGVAPWLARLRPDWKVRLALVPCPYASGAEKRVAEQIAGVHEVFSPWETTRWYFGARQPAWPRSPRGLVMFLGGDPWHALLLKRKLGYPVAGYFEKATFWSRFFDHQALASGEVGNLMVDRVEWRPERLPLRRIGLFPGSRPWQLRLTLGRYLLVAQQLLALGLEPVIIQSPYVTDRDLRAALARPLWLGLPSLSAEVQSERLILPDGQSVLKQPGGGQLADLDLAITIPGTNTAELACAGVPFVVTLHQLAYLGGGGLPGLIERLPLPSRWKVPMRERKLKRMRFSALPNQVAGREIVPELIVAESLDPIAGQIRNWVEDPAEVERIRKELQGVMGRPGATRRLAEWIGRIVDGQVG